MTPRYIELHIESLAYGGEGLAHHEGQVVFVRKTFPGDYVRVYVEKDMGGYLRGRVVEWFHLSPKRQPPSCKYFHACGGCQWQEYSYEESLKTKKEILSSTLRHVGNLRSLPPVIVAGFRRFSFFYRSRILLRGRLQKGRLSLGYFERGSRHFVAIKHCEIAHERINLLIKKLQCFDYPVKGSIHLRLEIQVALKGPEQGRMTLLLYPACLKEEKFLKPLAEIWSSYPQVLWAGFVSDAQNFPVFIYDHQFGINYFTQPGQFTQVHSSLNRLLRRWVFNWIRHLKPRFVLDAFCGHGNLSLGLGVLPMIEKIYGVEMNPAAIRVAKQTVEQHGWKHIRYFCEQTSKFLLNFQKCASKFDLIILDPPRRGLSKEVPLLENFSPQNILYISCQASTLARDLRKLMENGMYRISEIRLLDFFPQTYHIESVVLLQKRGK